MNIQLSRTNNSKTRKETKQQRFIRYLALILAILMFLGVATTIIYYLATRTWAADETEEVKVVHTSSLKDSEDVLVSVGLMYGSGITSSFEINAPYGYEIGMQYLDGEREYEPLWDIYTQTVTAMPDGNITQDGYTFYLTGDIYQTVIGGYHVQVDCDDLTRQQFETLMNDTLMYANSLGLSMIPAYINTGYALRLGHFSTWDQASLYLEAVQTIYPDRYVSVAVPKETAVTITNTYTNDILFEYDCGGRSEIGITAHVNDDGNNYIRTPAGNYYDGVFVFKRYNNGTVDGVSLINVLPLEAYIAGVLPSEISNTWPIEVQKEFAITVRSFTLTHLHKHDSLFFDLCCTTDCQVYRGGGRANELVLQAVEETKGMVVTYDDSIITAYYSSTMGGVTVSPSDAWGGSTEVPYLQAVETPWEDYEGHSNGFWITEISGADITERLQRAGYTELKSPVADVEILEYAKNSTYVKKLRLTDTQGNFLVLNNSDNIRISLSPYLNSANFVVGKGQVEYSTRKPYDSLKDGTKTVTTVLTSSGEQNAEITISDETYGEMFDKSGGYMDLDSFYVISENDMEKTYGDAGVSILTSDGIVSHNKRDAFAVSRITAPAFMGEEYVDLVVESLKAGSSDTHETVVVSDKSDEEVTYKIAYAENPENFIFVGKGWGHGVGISQWGSYDLAVMGHTAEEILLAYFHGAEIMNYWDTKNFKK